MHIFNRPEIHWMSILKSFVDIFVSFFEKGGNYYLPLNWEYIGFRFIDDNSYKEKMEKVTRSTIMEFPSVINFDIIISDDIKFYFHFLP